MSLDIAIKALAGDAECAKMYCGAYALVRKRDGSLWRTRTITPDVEVIAQACDRDGFLLPQYWSLPRIP